MRPEQDEIERRLSRLRDGLKNAGIKLTIQRLEVCREIASAGSHPDAESVFRGVRQRVPTISLDTVYRTLWTLVDCGLIDTLGVPHERTRFDGNTAPHHHFVCTRCGETTDFCCDAFDSLSVPEAVTPLGTVQKTQVEMRGICLRCAKAPASGDHQHATGHRPGRNQ